MTLAPSSAAGYSPFPCEAFSQGAGVRRRAEALAIASRFGRDDVRGGRERDALRSLLFHDKHRYRTSHIQSPMRLRQKDAKEQRCPVFSIRSRSAIYTCL